VQYAESALWDGIVMLFGNCRRKVHQNDTYTCARNHGNGGTGEWGA